MNWISCWHHISRRTIPGLIKCRWLLQVYAKSLCTLADLIKTNGQLQKSWVGSATRMKLDWDQSSSCSLQSLARTNLNLQESPESRVKMVSTRKFLCPDGWTQYKIQVMFIKSSTLSFFIRTINLNACGRLEIVWSAQALYSRGETRLWLVPSKSRRTETTPNARKWIKLFRKSAS